MLAGALRHHIARWCPPWRLVRTRACDIPGMITKEECKYYTWLGRYFAGRGEVVELGTWLGRSTFFIVEGLERNRRFLGRRLHVFDDYIWRSEWMNEYYAGRPPADRASFLPLFEQQVATFRNRLEVTQCKIADYAGNESLPTLTWSGGPIELLYVDCGRSLDVNEAWFARLAPSFIPGQTLIAMEDWQTYKETPPRPYNQTKLFTDSKGASLELVHELRGGFLATFRYRGA